MDNKIDVSSQAFINQFQCSLHKEVIRYYCNCTIASGFLLCEKCLEDEHCPQYQHTDGTANHVLQPFKLLLKRMFANHEDPKLLENHLLNKLNYVDNFQNEIKFLKSELVGLGSTITKAFDDIIGGLENNLNKKGEDLKKNPKRLEELLSRFTHKTEKTEGYSDPIQQHFSAQAIKLKQQREQEPVKKKISTFAQRLKKIIEASLNKEIEAFLNEVTSNDPGRESISENKNLYNPRIAIENAVKKEFKSDEKPYREQFFLVNEGTSNIKVESETVNTLKFRDLENNINTLNEKLYDESRQKTDGKLSLVQKIVQDLVILNSSSDEHLEESKKEKSIFSGANGTNHKENMSVPNQVKDSLEKKIEKDIEKTREKDKSANDKVHNLEQSKKSAANKEGSHPPDLNSDNSKQSTAHSNGSSLKKEKDKNNYKENEKSIEKEKGKDKDQQGQEYEKSKDKAKAQDKELPLNSVAPLISHPQKLQSKTPISSNPFLPYDPDENLSDGPTDTQLLQKRRAQPTISPTQEESKKKLKPNPLYAQQHVQATMPTSKPSKENQLQATPTLNPPPRSPQNLGTLVPLDYTSNQAFTPKNIYLIEKLENLKTRFNILSPHRIDTIVSLSGAGGDYCFAMSTQSKLVYATVSRENTVESQTTFDSTLINNPITFMTSAKFMDKDSQHREIIVDTLYLLCGYQDASIKMFQVPSGEVIHKFHHSTSLETSANTSISYLHVITDSILVSTAQDGMLTFFNLLKKKYIKKLKTSHQGRISLIHSLSNKPEKSQNTTEILTGGADGKIVRYRVKYSDQKSWENIDIESICEYSLKGGVTCCNRSFQPGLQHILIIGTTCKLYRFRIEHNQMIEIEAFDSKDKILEIVIVDYKDAVESLALVFKVSDKKVIKYSYGVKTSKVIGHIECQLEGVNLERGPTVQVLSRKPQDDMLIMGVTRRIIAGEKHEKFEIILHDLQLAIQ